MSLMQCRSCPATFTVGLLRCPRCGQMSSLFEAGSEGGEAMPKISVEGGPSNAGDPEVEVPDVAPQTVVETAPAAPEQETPVVEGGPVPEPAAEPVPVKTTARATKKTTAAKQ